MTQTTITAKDVAELRARTGAGMMDCKRALEEAGGDQSRAAEPMSLEAFLASPAPGGEGKSVAELVKEVSGKTGETVVLRHAVRLAPAEPGGVGLYLHHNRQVGVLVEGTGAGAAHQAGREVLRELAIHAASTVPLAVRGEDIPAEVLERERRIGEEQAAQEGKPEAIRAKIVEGKIRKFKAENALLDQPWVKDPARTIADVVAEAARAAGGEITVTRVVRLKVGEA
jgi:elongation factor Ts